MFVSLKQNLMYYRNNSTEFQDMPNWFHIVVIYLTFPLIFVLGRFTPQVIDFITLPLSEIVGSPVEASFIAICFLAGSALALISTLGFGASMQCLMGRVLNSSNKIELNNESEVSEILR